jgi:GR25 family glycosyltransferase involved in LPS biosynthesis
MKVNDFFDGVYWINSVHHPSRAANMERFFQKYKIKSTRIEAVYGDNLRFLVGEKQDARFYAGCLISHLQAMSLSKAKGEKRILILEDDVLPINNFEQMFENFSESKFHTEELWDMIFLGFIPVTDDDDTWDYRLLDGCYHGKYPNFFRGKRWLTGAYSYALNSEMRDFLLEELSTQTNDYWGVEAWMRNIDRFDGRSLFTEKGIFGYVPQLFCHADGISTTSPDEVEFRFERSVHPSFRTIPYKI